MKSTIFLLCSLILFTSISFATPPKTSLATSTKTLPGENSTRGSTLLKKRTREPGFELKFMCNLVDLILCQQAEATAVVALNLLDGVLKLRESVVVELTFQPFRKSQVSWSYFESHLLQSPDDGVWRTYPRALAKQFQLKDLPGRRFDIAIAVNANEKFYFESSAGRTRIGPQQYNFIIVFLREMIYGLGFSSSWSLFNKGQIAPQIDPGCEHNGQYVFTGFHEALFDKFLVTTTAGLDLPHQLTRFNMAVTEEGLVNQIFPEERDARIALKKSQTFQMLSSNMYHAVTTSQKLTFRLKDGNVFYLRPQTNPKIGRSIMLAAPSFDITMDDHLLTTGALTGAEGFSPNYIAPRTVLFLDTLGYPMRKHYGRF